jgi:hypothetical protein
MKCAWILVFVAALPAGAIAQDRRAPPPPRPPPEPDLHLWYEASVNASFEFLSSTFVSGNVFYHDAFYDAVGGDAQFGAVLSWTPRWGGWFHDAFVRPHIGYSHREFVGHRFTDSTGLAVKPGDLEIEATYLGLTFGSGRLPEDGAPGFMGYVTIQAGASFMDSVNVEAPALFAGKRRFIKSTTGFYISGGFGAEFMLERVSFRIELGFRSFGRPRDGGAPIDVSNDPIAAGYLLLGITFAF